MKRINFWQGQRITWQELKKNIKDTEKALNAVGAAFARRYDQPTGNNAIWSFQDWGLPTISAASALQDNVTVTLSAHLSADYWHPAIDDYLFTSGNIIISTDMYVYFKSGDIMLFEATDAAGVDFTLSGIDDIIPFSSATEYEVYSATLGFIADMAYTSASGTIGNIFTNLLNISAGVDNATTYKSDGYVSNDNSEYIRNYLTPVIPSGLLSAFIGTCWTSAETGAGGEPAHPFNWEGGYRYVGPIRKYWDINKAINMEFNTRTSVEELVDYSDTTKQSLDYYNHFCAIGTKLAVVRNDGGGYQSLWGGDTLEYVASGHLSGITLNVTQFGVDDNIFTEPAGRYDLRGYTQFLKEWSSAYLHFNYTSGLPDAMTYWSRTSAEEYSDKLTGYINFSSQTANSIMRLSPIYIGSGVVSGGGSYPTPNFDVSHHFSNHVFGAYFKNLNNTVKLHRMKGPATMPDANLFAAWCGMIYDVYAATAISHTNMAQTDTYYFDRPNWINFPVGTTGLDYSTIPKNNYIHADTDELWFFYYGQILRIHDNDNYAYSKNYFRPSDSLNYQGFTDTLQQYSLLGNSVFFDTNTSAVFRPGYGFTSASPDWENTEDYWMLSAISANGIKLYKIADLSLWADGYGMLSSTLVEGVTSVPYTGDGTDPSIYGHNGLLFVGLDQVAFDENYVADFTQSYSRSNYSNTSGNLNWFENTNRNQKSYKLAVVNYPSGSEQMVGSSAWVDSFWLYEKDLQTFTSASVKFDLPLTGIPASAGWYSNIIPLEAPEDQNAWWCIACENATQNVHIYRIEVPKQIYGWRKS